MYVNNQRDLQICQREISLVREFSTHPNIIKYVDSSIQRKSKRYYEINHEDNNGDDAIHEILLLTQYCSNGTLVVSYFEDEILDSFFFFFFRIV
jgi:AP2-associated kinase